jgi:hypothetical protein
MTASIAAFPVDAENLTTTRTGPSLHFPLQERVYPMTPDGLEVLEHAHAVFCPVTVVQVVECFTWVTLTLEAELNLA